MTCCNKSPITIYQGFPTKWNDESLLTVTFDSEILLDGFGAEFTIGEIVKTYTNIEEGFNINLSAQETGTLPLGATTGTLVIIDTENNKRPFSTELPFMVKDWADGNIKLDGFDISINAKIQENKLTIHIQSANPDSTVEEMIKRYVKEHNQSEQAHPYIRGLISDEARVREESDSSLQLEIDKKQNILTAGDGIAIENNIISNTGVLSVTTGNENGTISVNDLNVSVNGLGTAAFTSTTDYATSEQGSKADTALQPSALNGYATEVWVGQQGFLTGITSGMVTTALGYSPVNPTSLASVATSGAYSDLSGKPSILSSVSSSSTNSDTIGAKLFYDTCGDIEILINAL